MDEAALIDACRRGNRHAQRELYERHADRVYRLVLRLSGNAHDAFDLSQETFVRAFQGLERFDARAAFGTWLYRIAINEARQLFRRRATEQRHLQLLRNAGEQATRPDSDGAPDVERALRLLSPEHQAMLLLRYQQGLTYNQIAEALEIAPGTVASRLNRARTELRDLVGDESPNLEEGNAGRHPITQREPRTAPHRQVEQ